MKKRPAKIEFLDLPTPPPEMFWEIRTIPLFEVAVLHLRKKKFFGSKEIDSIALRPIPDEPLDEDYVYRAAITLLKRYSSRLEYQRAAARLAAVVEELEEARAELATLERRSNNEQ